MIFENIEELTIYKPQHCRKQAFIVQYVAMEPRNNEPPCIEFLGIKTIFFTPSDSNEGYYI